MAMMSLRENKEWVSVHNPLEDRDLRDLDKALDMWEDLVSNRRVTPKKIEGMLMYAWICVRSVYVFVAQMSY